MENASSNSDPGADAHWSVFILCNPAGRFFVGHTNDLPGVLVTADTEVAKWTGQPGPWPLVWRHDGLTQAAALKYEISLKRDKNSPRFYTRTGLKPLVESKPPQVPSPTAEVQP